VAGTDARPTEIFQALRVGNAHVRLLGKGFMEVRNAHYMAA
jgi:hypothetical protein